MKIIECSIQDTFATKAIRFQPKSVTRFRGTNGCGKSSVLNGLLRPFKGGSDPTIIRDFGKPTQAEKAVVEFKTDDGAVYTLTCAPIKRKRGEDVTAPLRYNTTLEILQPDGTPRPAPKSYLDSLADVSAIDPGRILSFDTSTAPGQKALAETLLQIVPIAFTPEEIARKLSAEYREGSEIAKLDVAGLALPAISSDLDLDGLKKFALQVTEQRRRVGNQRDDAEGAININRKSLPEDDGTDYADALQQAEAYHVECVKAQSAAEREVEKRASTATATATAEYTRECSDVVRDINAKILELERERATRKSAVLGSLDEAKKKIFEATQEGLLAIKGQAEPEIQKAVADIAKFKEKVEGQSRSKFVKEQLDINERNYRTHSSKYRQLTEVLVRLEELRKEKLDALPIAGLEVSSDTVLVDGVAWKNVNTARKVEVAVQLCTLRAGKLGIIFIDDCEHLDTQTREMLEQGLVEAGFQLFLAMVSDDPELVIEAVDLDLAAAQ